ncbi:MAG: hypothetical protein GX197_10435 [Firmicutes bacterium]|nr:hypothetical protein [Bacillota bacterium]NLP36421.1 hypothetical protein [Bacillota bacterium]
MNRDSYQFADLKENEVAKIRETEEFLNAQNSSGSDEIILLAYKPIKEDKIIR